MKIVIAGGSAAGMFAALILARAGHDIVLIDRESLDAAPDVESASAHALRPGAPHIVQPHIIMPKCRELLRDHLPDVYEGLLAAGVAVAGLWTQMQASLADKTPQPGDERLTLLMSRRSTVDWVLRRAIARQPGITLRGSMRVVALTARPGHPPHVTGVRTQWETMPADLLIDASGCRSAIDRWLVEIGARPSRLERAECGIAYFSRHFRFRPGAAAPGLATSRIVAGLKEFNIGIWGADNGRMQMAIAPLAMDHRFLTARHPEVFTAVLRTVPTYAAWLEALEPITDVYVMGGLQNTLRRLVIDGGPVATGLHALGDSVCTTNPTLGRGLSFALWEALALRDILRDHGEDWSEQALAMDAFVGENIAPFYEEQAAVDSTRMAMMRHTIFGEPKPESATPREDRVSYGELRAAAQFDPTAFRALWRIHGMVEKPLDVYMDREVGSRTRAALAENRDRLTMAEPTREQLEAALAGR